MTAQTTSTQRRYDLDWLRVFVVFAIFGLHHATRFFDTDEWLIKNAGTYPSVQVWTEFCTSWGMPLILVISGASAFLALEKTRPGRYVGGLVLRLFIPLIVGIFTHIAFLIYLERLHKGTFSGSFFDFYPHYFEGMYGFGGNFAWMGLHLWYLELLFLLSLFCLPLFLWFKRTATGRHVLAGIASLLMNPAAVLLLALPTLLLILNLDENGPGNQSMGGWSVVIYPLFYVAGFVILSNERLQNHIVRMRRIHLGMGLVLATVYLWVEFQTTIRVSALLTDRLGKALDCFVVWSWLLTVMGFGMAHLKFTNPLLKYANEAVLPFYVLHMTVLVAVGFLVIRWPIPDPLKYVVILAASLLVILGMYEFGVRRFNLIRFLFGMKPKSRRSPDVRPVLVEQGA